MTAHTGSAPPQGAPLPPHTSVAGASPNELRAGGAASPSYREWESRHHHELEVLAERERLADEQRKMSDEDRWQIVYPAWERHQAALEARAPRTPISRTQLAGLGLAAGAIYGLVRSAGRKDTIHVLGDVLLGGAVGAVTLYAVGDMCWRWLHEALGQHR